MRRMSLVFAVQFLADSTSATALWRPSTQLTWGREATQTGLYSPGDSRTLKKVWLIGKHYGEKKYLENTRFLRNIRWGWRMRSLARVVGFPWIRFGGGSWRTILSISAILTLFSLLTDFGCFHLFFFDSRDLRLRRLLVLWWWRINLGKSHHHATALFRWNDRSCGDISEDFPQQWTFVLRGRWPTGFEILEERLHEKSHLKSFHHFKQTLSPLLPS